MPGPGVLGRAEAESFASLIRDRIGKPWIGVAKDSGPVGTDVVDKAVSIGVEDVGSLGVLDKKRGSFDR